MKKGKNFSGNNTGKRRASDFYQTPYSMTQQLLDVEYFDNTAPVLEPACGDGAIIKVLHDNKFRLVDSIDINRDLKINFIKTRNLGKYNYIIKNPPFSLAKEFILKSKELYTDKIASLLPLSYLHGQERYRLRLFNELKHIHVFTRYPMLTGELRDDGKYETGMMVYAWYVWSKGYAGDPKIKWIDNNKYVIGSQKKDYAIPHKSQLIME